MSPIATEDADPANDDMSLGDVATTSAAAEKINNYPNATSLQQGCTECSFCQADQIR